MPTLDDMRAQAANKLNIAMAAQGSLDSRHRRKRSEEAIDSIMEYVFAELARRGG